LWPRAAAELAAARSRRWTVAKQNWRKGLTLEGPANILLFLKFYIEFFYFPFASLELLLRYLQGMLWPDKHAGLLGNLFRIEINMDPRNRSYEHEGDAEHLIRGQYE
jgi:hypothetical protein